MAPPFRTLNELADESFRLFAERPFLGLAASTPLTYTEAHEQSLALAAALLDLQVKPGHAVAILGENLPSWGVAALAIIRAGAAIVPILPDFPEADIHHILKDSGAKILFTTERHQEKLYECNNVPLSLVITLDDSSGTGLDVTVIPFSQALRRGRNTGQKSRKPPKAAADDLAAIIYTSGTSGHSKAVMLSHKNFCANVASAAKICHGNPKWRFLSLLPLSHTYEFTIGFLLPMALGAGIIYPGKPPTPTVLEAVCREARPTAMCVVPLIMEKIHKKKVLAAIQQNIFLKTACRVTMVRKYIMRAAGKKLLRFFGGRLELVAIGGAPLNRSTEQFLHEARFPYIIGYGLTEAAPLLAAGPLHDPTVAVGSTGRPVPGVELAIKAPHPESGIGEILARGANIMLDYRNNPDLTRETINADGWLATGDLGLFDSHGNLHIKGRSKSVIVLSSGENIYPEVIEDRLNRCLHVMESLVVERDGRLQAKIYLDYDLIDSEISGKSETERLSFIATMLQNLRKQVNSGLPLYAKIHSCVEQPEPFIKTATHKIKRYLYN